MARGLTGLATVAGLSPFLGMLGNVVGIVESFVGVDGEKTAIMAFTAGRLSDSILPMAFGLGAGIVALVAYQYFRARLGEIDAEMQCMILQLPGYLRGR